MRVMITRLIGSCFIAFACFNPGLGAEPLITGELKKWHSITLTFDGPEASEAGAPNPFRDYRLEVEFSRGRRVYRVAGYFAADGKAAETGADHGNKWRAHFSPDDIGTWQYRARLTSGPDVAIRDDAPGAHEIGRFEGSFLVKPGDKQKPDFRARGRLEYAGKRYLQFAETKDFFIKGGADSPENFLAFHEFDQTPGSPLMRTNAAGEASRGPVHRYAPHARDWHPGDPSWRGGRGKNIIGALNYLAGKGMNSVYFLTMNVGGDGDDVWPWTGHDERRRFDCSKLDQWEIVFAHMDRLGLLLHVITQETENDHLLDGGDLGPERKLYYRELAARFGHHLGVVWNLGEENRNSEAQHRAFANYFREVDPYRHPIVVHTYPGQYDKVYNPLLGFENFEGPSLQMGDMKLTHTETLKWVDRSTRANRPWIVCLDEIGPSHTGVMPDADDPDHDAVRKAALWGNLMAGGAGCEWYFGYKFPNNDLNCEDWRSRDRMWDQTRYAMEFFQKNIPFSEMDPADGLVTGAAGFCLAKRGNVYAVYLLDGGAAEVLADPGLYQVSWFNPRTGEMIEEKVQREQRGAGKMALGKPPKESARDWVVLVRAARK